MKFLFLSISLLLSQFTLVRYAFSDDAAITNYTMELIVGDVSVSQDAGVHWSKAETYSDLNEMDQIRTGPDSYCEITLPGDNGSIRIMENSEFVIEKSGQNSRVKINKGNSLFDIVKKLETNETFEVETETTIASVRGTEFLVGSSDESGRCSVVHGVVAVSRNITDLPGNESLRNEAQESMAVNAGENQEVEYTKAENTQISENLRKFRGHPRELRNFLAEQRAMIANRPHPIRDRERLLAILKKHQEERQIIRQKRSELIKYRLERRQKFLERREMSADKKQEVRETIKEKKQDQRIEKRKLKRKELRKDSERRN